MGGQHGGVEKENPTDTMSVGIQERRRLKKSLGSIY